MLLILLQIGVLVLTAPKAMAFDQDLVDRLNQDLKHEVERRNAFKQYEAEKKLNNKEQNKGLALWLEEQEQWDLAREKAVFEHRKQKKFESPSEGSKEHLEDIAVKERDLRVIEDGRKQHIQIKKKVLAQYEGKDEVSEEQELAIYNNRPRYDLRKRGRNKWMKGGASLGVGQGSSGGSGGYNPGGGFQNDNFDFPPPPPADFNNVPTDSFDDFPPPPPPPTDFGNAPGTFDSGFGDAPIPPPPPPPPPEGGWDF